ncbi:MAG: Methyltransferase type 11 [Thermoleophilia bacterium]|nr:Methyltransferase type 11 [Thermoleophilia bacterium]
MEPSATAAPDHIAVNEQWWKERTEGYQHVHAAQLPTRHPTWGIFSTPNSSLDVLRGPIADRDVVELGGGGAQFSTGLAREGARCTSVDFSQEQVDFATKLLDEAEREDGVRPDVTLVLADVEDTGLPSASFDVAISDYGASMYADPYRWVPEAARLLRPGGRLAFSLITPIHEISWHPKEDMTNQLVKDYFGMHRIDDGSAVLFNLPYGEWVRLFRRSGFTIVDLVETQPPADMDHSTYRSENQLEWARRWPAEMIWVLDRDA